MKRIKDKFLDSIEGVVLLSSLQLLEIGCGDGSRSVEILNRCGSLIAIDPDPENISRARARAHNLDRVVFQIGSGEKLNFTNQQFDLVIFTLSFHHIPAELMEVAIGEALRVTRPNGYIVFLEPAKNGSFFEAEICFDACDGDERKEKAAAYDAMRNYQGIRLIAELPDETIFQFESTEDFIHSMNPKRRMPEISQFLADHDFLLTAQRRINIYQPTINE